MLRVTWTFVSLMNIPVHKEVLTACVDKKCLLTRGRMSTNDRMLVLHGVSSINSSPLQTILGLFESRMHRFKTMETLFDCG